MIVLCDCCHSEYNSEEFFNEEQLCPECFKMFVIDPQLDNLKEADFKEFMLNDYVSELTGENYFPF